MRNKKTLIISIAVAVLVCVTLIILIFATNLFKGSSNKENFKKYFAEMEIKELVDLEAINTEIQRKTKEKYKTEGSISINVNINNTSIVDEVIEFNTKSDPENKKDSSEVNIKIDGKETLKVNYLRNKDVYGVLFKNLVNKYIALENKDLNKFTSSALGGLPISIPDKIEIPENYKELLNAKEINEIISKYLNIIIEEMPEDNFVKINEESYSVKINKEVLSKILEKLLNTIKEDEKVLSLINKATGEELSKEQYKEVIDKYFEKISLEEFNEEFEIIVYRENKTTKRIELRNNKNVTISLDKSNGEIALIINVSSEKQGNMNLTLRKSKEGEASIKLKIGEDESAIEISIVLKSNTTFDPEIKIEELKKGDYLLLNDLSSKQIQNLATNLSGEIIKKTNIKDGIIGNALNMFSSGIFGASKDIEEEVEETVEDSVDNASKQAIEIFNSSLEVYEGKQRGASVKGLISSIKSKNSMDRNHTIECDYAIEDIESSKTYNISFKKDSEGYINRVIIEEQ